MYEDTYTYFDNVKYGEYAKSNIICRKPFAEWDYGDTFNIILDISNFDVQIGDDLAVIIQDSRHDVILEEHPNELVNDSINIYINSELSDKMIPGNYYLTLKLFREDYRSTLINPTDCWLHVR